MPLEKGGRADKAGNKYEINCIIYELLKVLDETNYSVVIEALGEDEEGTDILVTNSKGIKEHQQCKARNASKEYWELSDLKSRNILENWKKQLNRDENRQVALVSPIGCSFLVDLHDRALNTNGDIKHFYDIQIKKSSKEFKNFYESLCKNFDIDISKEEDILKSISFFKRIFCKQISEYELKECIYHKIQFYFITDKSVVYNALVSFVVTEDIWGKDINVVMLKGYLEQQDIKFRLIDGDKRVVPQINVLNQEYRDSFRLLKEGLIQRNEFEKCIDIIKEEQNLIISGNAGYGKSGCTEAIINYCEKEQIPYIAIKLDRKIPQRSCEFWGKELGFQGPIYYALHSISQNKQAVIILDQLDALRWTQANSSQALSVCMELIKQVRYLNHEREKKISIVFVCRTYDLNNDNNIKELFNSERNAIKHENEWKKVIIQQFDETIVQQIVGKKYKDLTVKSKKLLQIPSNLYIWQHLDEEESYNDCTTTSHLIKKWYEQILKKSESVGVEEQSVIKVQEQLVTILDKIGRLYAPKSMLKFTQKGLDYLVSAEMVTVEKNKVGFVHQSILDYFISEKMVNQYFEGNTIEEIIGEKNKQTPNKRYQIQMFLQSLLEYDSQDFLAAGENILLSNGARYYVKYVFYEILRQITNPDENIIEFIKENCKNEKYTSYLLNNVIFGQKSYIAILRDCGILEQWFTDIERKEVVFNLFKSISPDLDFQDIKFIKEHSFKDEEDDKKFWGCFIHNIIKESDELFELRMLFYNKYPEWTRELYIDIKSLMENFEIRAIRLISFWLKNKIVSNGENVYWYAKELIDECDSFLLKNAHYILEELLYFIPKEDSFEIKYSDWSMEYHYNYGLERVVVELIKKANEIIIEQNPKLFWDYYKPYMGKNYMVYNEIILQGLCLLPISYSNQIIFYLSSELDNKIFDYTSGAKDRLGLVKEVIKVHSIFCDEKSLICLEKVICKYISPMAVEWYKNRIEYNKRKEDEPRYWSFWGDLQYQLLQSIPFERLTKESQDLLKILDRKFAGQLSYYISSDMYSGTIESPISGKKIGKKQWLRIITNKNLVNTNRSEWNEVKGCFIESSIKMYLSNFSSVVQNEPEEMIQLVLEHREEIIPNYIDSMYAGVEFSGHISEVNKETWEKLFKLFPCDMKSQRVSSFCGILGKLEIYTWSLEILEQLKNIALNYKEKKTKTGFNLKDEIEVEPNCEKIYDKALSYVRGKAVRAIGHLLWDNKKLFLKFKEVIDILTLDEELEVRMASFFALWPIYNIDREWAEIRILRVYESDVRMAIFRDSRNMFFRLYPKYKERVIRIIKKCFESEDKKLIKVGGYSVCEFFIRNNEFTEIIFNVQSLKEEQMEAILHMSINYLEYEEHRDKVKKIILKCKNSDNNIEFPLGGIFCNEMIDIQRDSEFLLELMKSKVGKKLVVPFVHFLEESACCIIDYADIIIALCENVLSMDLKLIEKQWGIEDDISKLIISLYDESANSERSSDKQIAEKCLELWDIMFEKQLGKIRKLSYELMER